MGGLIDYHKNEVSQTEKGKHHMISFIHGISFKMIQMNLFTKQKETHRFQKQIHGYQRGNVGRRGKLRSLALTYTHCYI